MNESKSIRVFAPATVANVVCGFDVLGFAVHVPGDEVIMKLTATPGVVLKAVHGDQGRLPLDPELNTVSSVVRDYLNSVGAPAQGVEIELFKKMPIGSGLGSSAASNIAGLYAVNRLMGDKLDLAGLLPLAIRGECLACGQGHADNVAPALMGGFVLIRSYEPLDIIRLPSPSRLVCSLLHPQIEIQTRDARRILKKNVVLSDVIRQMGHVSGMIAGLYREDLDLIGRSLVDVIIEPTRAILIPEFQTLRRMARDLGAIGLGISGSGPSVFALSDGEETAHRVVRELGKFLLDHDIESEGYVSRINLEGPRVLD